eukprot:2835525-Rhodomonas_salina.1
MGVLGRNCRRMSSELQLKLTEALTVLCARKALPVSTPPSSSSFSAPHVPVMHGAPLSSCACAVALRV